MGGRDAGEGGRSQLWRGLVAVAWLGMAANHLRVGDVGNAVASGAIGVAWGAIELRERRRRPSGSADPVDAAP